MCIGLDKKSVVLWKSLIIIPILAYLIAETITILSIFIDNCDIYYDSANPYNTYKTYLERLGIFSIMDILPLIMSPYLCASIFLDYCRVDHFFIAAKISGVLMIANIIMRFIIVIVPYLSLRINNNDISSIYTTDFEQVVHLIMFIPFGLPIIAICCLLVWGFVVCFKKICVCLGSEKDKKIQEIEKKYNEEKEEREKLEKSLKETKRQLDEQIVVP